MSRHVLGKAIIVVLALIVFVFGGKELRPQALYGACSSGARRHSS